jgi:eukaryotic-like serine/threonine-protein kinase
MMSQGSGSSGEGFSIELIGAASSTEDDQIMAALEEYATLKRAGNPPRREEFLARHGTIAEALADCLDGLELVEDAARHFSTPPLP